VLHNAVKFTQEGGICVRVAPLGTDHLRITVTDSGSGIPEDNLDKVFDRFSTGRPQSPHAGSGLGLPLSRELLHLMGGTIRLRSSPGSGTQAEIDLPRDMTRRDQAQATTGICA